MPPDKIGTNLDIGIVIVYFVVVFGFGSYFGRYAKSTKDFFFGGQRFSWWLIAMSCVATLVGSYSFIKYSEKSFIHGVSGTYGYLNDWFWMPFYILGWLPIIYFSRVGSIPEYFERRFGRHARTAATGIILLYMIGYIGINLLTMATALSPILGWDKMTTVWVVATICAVYVTAGGQTSVIMTDLLQGFLLLLAGLAILVLGVMYLGGWDVFWGNFPASHKLALPNFSSDPGFSTAGIFWQDGMANSAAFWFMNQGIILRFLSVKSVKEGRKAVTAVMFVLMPLAAIAVCDAGWIGRVMVDMNLDLKWITPDMDSNKIFVFVTETVCRPGIFGLVLAALTSALMSTVDTLINAVSSVTINDLYRPYMAKNRSEKHYLSAARVVSIIATLLGIAMVPVLMKDKSLFEAHVKFTASITPPMVVAIILGLCWRRYNYIGVMATMVLGMLAIFASFDWGFFDGTFLLSPFHIGDVGDKYIRAFYGLVVCGGLGIVFTFFAKKPAPEQLDGFVMMSEKRLMERYKGSAPNLEPGEDINAPIKMDTSLEDQIICLPDSLMTKLAVRTGDLVHISYPAWWHGGIRSTQATVGEKINDGSSIVVSSYVKDCIKVADGGDAHVEKIM
jgi:solute:Na+ symporter, SSS family